MVDIQVGWPHAWLGQPGLALHKINNLSFFLFFFFLCDRVYLCSPGCPGTHYVDQVGLKLRDPLASASLGLGIKMGTAATTTWLPFLKMLYVSCHLKKKIYLMYMSTTSLSSDTPEEGIRPHYR